MAAIAKSGTPSLASPTPPPNEQATGLTAYEDLGAYDVVYIRSDGKVAKANGAAANALAAARGVVPGVHKAGDKDVTIYFGRINVRYGSGMTPGVDFYLSGATAGGIDSATSTGATVKIGFVLDATRVRFHGFQV